MFDRDDADPLGWRRVVATVSHDLFGTKDVQDVVTASYVWVNDQFGHIALGLLPTMLACWIWRLLLAGWIDPAGKLGPWWHTGVCVGLAIVVLAVWAKKEYDDYVVTEKRAGKDFPFDKYDIVWNIHTALVYFAIGGALGLTPFVLHPLWLPVVFAVACAPAFLVGFWWLRRKLAYQQAGLPYLYRLANFCGVIDEPSCAAVAGIANLADRPVNLWDLCFHADTVPQNDPKVRHILIAGPLGAGKTSLAVGIGTEFAFGLGIGRYLSVSKLMELIDAPQPGGQDNAVDYDDGRVLWPWRQCDLLIVDDVDSGLPVSTEPVVVNALPTEFRKAVEPDDVKPLAWLAHKRTVWVLGNTDMLKPWKSTIAGLLGIGVDEIMTVELAAPPPR
jgi:hypothetical protein